MAIPRKVVRNAFAIVSYALLLASIPALFSFYSVMLGWSYSGSGLGVLFMAVVGHGLLVFALLLLFIRRMLLKPECE